MEYAAGGNLYQLVAMSGGLPEQDARWYFQQLIFAIDYCHKMVRATPATCITNLAAPLLNVAVFKLLAPCTVFSLHLLCSAASLAVEQKKLVGR